MAVTVIWESEFGNERYRVQRVDCSNLADLTKCTPQFYIDTKVGDGPWVAVHSSTSAHQAVLGAFAQLLSQLRYPAE